MRRLAVGLALAVCGPFLVGTGLWAKSGNSEVPQTARQALMEMFFSKEPGTFLKHLPAALRATLEKSPALAGLKQYSTFTTQAQTQGKNLQTFEAGPVMLSADDPKTGDKVEIVVESDSLKGDEDDIELSFRSYKDNQPKKTAFKPRIVFSMKMEAGLWTLNDIAITFNLPLGDPDFLKGVADRMAGIGAGAKPTIQEQAMGQSQARSAGQAAGATFGDANALASVRKILAAETTYAATYPAVGYTCTLSDLDGSGASEASEHQAMLISSGLASGKHLGYSFSLAGCAGAPAARFQLTAAPTGESYGRRAFCSDQSGAIRASSDGSAATCASRGTPVP